MHLSDAVLESVMVFRLGAGAVAEVVVPLCLALLAYCCTIYCIVFCIVLRLRPSYPPKSRARSPGGAVR